VFFTFVVAKDGGFFLDIAELVFIVVFMYVRKSIKKEKGKTYTSHALVESVRTPKGPRQKVVCTLGDLSPRPLKEWLKLAHKVENALVGQEELLGKPSAEVEEIVRKVKERRAREQTTPEKPPDKGGEEDDLVAVHTDRATTERHRCAGHVHVGYQFWKRLGLDDIVREAGLTERACTLTCAMTLNRLVHPASEHAMPRWIRSTALEDILGIDFEQLADDSLYRNLDKLYPNRAAIESALAERERNLFNLDPTVFFYDLTSTYFEGMALNNPKAKRGYSRDKRPDCKSRQKAGVIGLVVGREGFPVAHEVFGATCRTQSRSGSCWILLTRGWDCPRGRPWWWTGGWRTRRTSRKSGRETSTTSWRVGNPSAIRGSTSSRRSATSSKSSERPPRKTLTRRNHPCG
jgi:hypothetical protein